MRGSAKIFRSHGEKITLVKGRGGAIVKHEHIPGGEFLPSRNDTVKIGKATVFHERGGLAFGGVRFLGKTDFIDEPTVSLIRIGEIYREKEKWRRGVIVLLTINRSKIVPGKKFPQKHVKEMMPPVSFHLIHSFTMFLTEAD